MTAEPYAKVIEDSISPHGDRLTTMEVRLHRYVLAELNTHKAPSRNSASSRAIPLRKQIERVMDEPAIPLVWPSEQSGMQGGEPLSDYARKQAEHLWRKAAADAAESAARMHALGIREDERLHKSVANRLLEPFLMHTVVMTSTAWQNFFGLRDHENAQPEIAVPARMMREAYEVSEPTKLTYGQWHLPYIQDEDFEIAEERVGLDTRAVWHHLVKISSARCARVSYLTHDGKRDHQADLDLYDRLTSARPMHASPLEHVATPAGWNKHRITVESEFTGRTMTLTLPKYGNLLGWHNHRFDVEVELGYQSFS